MLFVIFIIALQAFFRTDTPLYWAIQNYPLGESHTYIIKQNKEIVSKDGDTIFGPGIAYVVHKTHNKELPPDTSGLSVGSSDVDLKPFLNTPVHIKGVFFIGKPYKLSDGIAPVWFFTNSRVVLHISRIDMVK